MGRCVVSLVDERSTESQICSPTVFGAALGTTINGSVRCAPLAFVDGSVTNFASLGPLTAAELAKMCIFCDHGICEARAYPVGSRATILEGKFEEVRRDDIGA
jgi:hypothetical protein